MRGRDQIQGYGRVMGAPIVGRRMSMPPRSISTNRRGLVVWTGMTILGEISRMRSRSSGPLMWPEE